MNILIAIDGSAVAEQACVFAGKLKGLKSPTAYVIHVTRPLPEPPMPFPTVFSENDLIVREQIEKEHEVAAGERLEACRAYFPKSWTVKTEHRVGSPAAEILNAIDTLEVDLAVLGATGMDVTRWGRMGNVAQKVTRYAHCPVLLVREGAEEAKTVLVAVDEGPTADRVIDYVADAPFLKKAALTFCHVVENRYLLESRIAATQFQGSERYLARLQTALLEEGEKILTERIARLPKRTPAPEVRVLEGEPAATIDAEGERFDLIVLGARGRHGLGRILLGSTSQKMLRHGTVSMLVIRPAD